MSRWDDLMDSLTDEARENYMEYFDTLPASIQELARKWPLTNVIQGEEIPDLHVIGYCFVDGEPNIICSHDTLEEAQKKGIENCDPVMFSNDDMLFFEKELIAKDRMN